MRAVRVVATLAVLGTVGAQAARADYKDFLNFCSPGAIRTCASLTVTTTLLSGGGTSVTIMVRNLQGSGYGVDNTGGSIITRIGLVAPSINGATGLSVTSTNAPVGTPGSSWFLSNPGSLGGPIELTAGITAGTVAGGIVGCNAPQGWYPSSYFSTCGAGDWVIFQFTTTNNWSANDAQVAWLTQRFAINGSGLECDSNGGSTTGRTGCVQITPEPVTMLLLGSGLAGVGGVGIIRRRKGKDVESA